MGLSFIVNKKWQRPLCRAPGTAINEAWVLFQVKLKEFCLMRYNTEYLLLEHIFD